MFGEPATRSAIHLPPFEIHARACRARLDAPDADQKADATSHALPNDDFWEGQGHSFHLSI